MPDALRRGLRTLLQGLPPAGMVAAWVAFVGPLDMQQTAAAMLVLTAVSSAAINALEDAGAIPAFGKAPASDGAHPTPPDAGGIT